MEAYLWKKGKSMFHMLSKRYYLLSGNCMYYYSHKSDVRPRGTCVALCCAQHCRSPLTTRAALPV
jgi:hypothetical protein